MENADGTLIGLIVSQYRLRPFSRCGSTVVHYVYINKQHYFIINTRKKFKVTTSSSSDSKIEWYNAQFIMLLLG